jgi:hypothetical protein
MTSDETIYRTRIVPGGGLGWLILRAWIGGMLGMALGLAVTFGNPVGGMAGLLAPMLWIIWRGTRRVEIGVSARGVRESPLGRGGAPLADEAQFHRWDQIASWTVDADQVRGVGERRYVDLRMRNGHRLKFREPNELADDPQFTAIATALEAYATGSAAVSDGPAAAPALPASALPERRPGFYERPIAKFVASVFILCTLALLGVAATRPELVNGANAFRIGAVLVPGTLYVAWRAFRRRA